MKTVLSSANCLALVLATSLLAGPGGVLAGENLPSSAWILTGESPLLDRSSKYLFKGNTDAGIKYAMKALARSQSAYTSVIAHQNLCLAFAHEGRTDQAALHCTVARDSEMGNVALTEIKPGLYKISRRPSGERDALMLAAVIAKNLQGQGQQDDSAHLADAGQPH